MSELESKGWITETPDNSSYNNGPLSMEVVRRVEAACLVKIEEAWIPIVK